MRKLLILLLITTNLMLLADACIINQQCQGEYLNQDEYIFFNNGGSSTCTINNSIRCCGGDGVPIWNVAIMNYYDNLIPSADFSVELDIRNIVAGRIIRSGLSHPDVTNYNELISNIVPVQMYWPGSAWYPYCYGVQGTAIPISDSEITIKYIHPYNDPYIYGFVTNGNGTWINMSWSGYDCLISNLTAFSSSPLVSNFAVASSNLNDCSFMDRIGIIGEQKLTTQFRVKNYNQGINNCSVELDELGGNGFTPPSSNTSGGGYSSPFTLYPTCYWNEDNGWEWFGYVLADCSNNGVNYDFTKYEFLSIDSDSSGHLYTINMTYNISTTTTTSTSTTTTIPFYFTINAAASPDILAPGDFFNVYASAVGEGFDIDYCIYTVDSIDGTYTGDSIAFAYNEEGNEWVDTFNMGYDPDYYWQYRSRNAMQVNDSTPAGKYFILVECYDANENLGVKKFNVTVASTDNTSIKWVTNPLSQIPKNTVGNFVIAYEDYQKNYISGADCILGYNRTSNQTLLPQPGNVYKQSILFLTGGNVVVDVWCNKTGYLDAHSSKSYTIIDTNTGCFNGIKDGGETGIDCGGLCLPCTPTTTLPGGGSGCTEVDDICGSDSDCCDGLYCRLSRNPKVCRTPTCYDNYKNQGEAQVDCGGSSDCLPCAACIYDNDCGDDGSWMCNVTSGYQCDRLTCTSDADCPILTNWYTNGVGVEQKQTYCDMNRGICTLENRNTINQTTLYLGMDISPITGFMANKSGTLFYTLNCDDSNNGFIVRTNISTQTFYNFASSPYNPALPYDPYLRVFDDGKTGTNKKALINELCGPVNGYGGMPINSSSMFTRINFISSGGSTTYNKLVDVIVYRHSIKNSLSIGEIQHTTETEYNMSVTNRSIFVQARKSPSDQYTNVTTDYILNVFFNASQISNDLKNLPIFYYRLNTPYGERYEYKYGKPWWMPITYTKEDGFGLNFTIREWMIWIILALIIMGAVYANYRLQARHQ